jgi:hypothetical protein
MKCTPEARTGSGRPVEAKSSTVLPLVVDPGVRYSKVRAMQHSDWLLSRRSLYPCSVVCIHRYSRGSGHLKLDSANGRSPPK